MCAGHDGIQLSFGLMSAAERAGPNIEVDAQFAIQLRRCDRVEVFRNDRQRSKVDQRRLDMSVSIPSQCHPRDTGSSHHDTDIAKNRLLELYR